MYIMDDLKKHPDYVKLLYTEATSAGSVCTMARALLSNIEAYMGPSDVTGDPDRIHPSVRLTMNSLREMIVMRDNWLRRLRDLSLAERSPLPFDELNGNSVPIETKRKAIDATVAIDDAVTRTGENTTDVDLIFRNALAAVGVAEAPTKPRRRRRKAISMAGTAGQTGGQAAAGTPEEDKPATEPYYPDPKGEPGVAEAAAEKAAEVEAKADESADAGDAGDAEPEPKAKASKAK